MPDDRPESPVNPNVHLCDRCNEEHGGGIADAGDLACSACGSHNAPHVYAPVAALSTPAGPSPERTWDGETCQSCGGEVAASCPTWWYADDALWREVTGEEEGIRCIPCFTREAQEEGICVKWTPVVDARFDGGQWVEEPAPSPREEAVEAAAIVECSTCGMPVRVVFEGSKVAKVLAVCKCPRPEPEATARPSSPGPTCGDRGWHTAGGNEPSACGRCPAGEVWSARPSSPTPEETEAGEYSIYEGTVLYEVNVEGGGTFFYDALNVGRFARRMAEEGDRRRFSVACACLYFPGPTSRTPGDDATTKEGR